MDRSDEHNGTHRPRSTGAWDVTSHLMQSDALWVGNRRLSDRFATDSVTLEQEIAAIENRLATLAARCEAMVQVWTSIAELAELVVRAEENVAARHEAERIAASQNAPQTEASPSGSARLDHVRYRQLIDRIRQAVREVVPVGATVVVISRGDEALVQFDERHGWHFPQLANGVYAGHYPANGADAVVQIEALRARGGAYLLIPQTAFWWLDYYVELRQHLDQHYRRVYHDEEVCCIYALREGVSASPEPSLNGELLARHELHRQIWEIVDRVLPNDAAVIVVDDGAGSTPELGDRLVLSFPIVAPDSSDPGSIVDTTDAVLRLETLRAAGSRYLLVPRTAFRWLHRSGVLRDYLAQHARRVIDQKHLCLLFDLSAVHHQQADRAVGRRLSSRPTSDPMAESEDPTG